MKGHCPFPPYLSLFDIFPLIYPLDWFGHWVFQASKWFYLALWEEGDKGQEGKSSRQKIKSKISNLEMLVGNVVTTPGQCRPTILLKEKTIR
jgi:hypothetical protein